MSRDMIQTSTSTPRCVALPLVDTTLGSGNKVKVFLCFYFFSRLILDFSETSHRKVVSLALKFHKLGKKASKLVFATPWLITFELANQRARKVLFTCVVYTKFGYSSIPGLQSFAPLATHLREFR